MNSRRSLHGFDLHHSRDLHFIIDKIYYADLQIHVSTEMLVALVTMHNAGRPERCSIGRQHDLAEHADRAIAHDHRFRSRSLRRSPTTRDLEVIRHALKPSGVEFIDENGGGAGVRLRKPRRNRKK